MTGTTLAIAEVPSAPEAYGASAQAASSNGKSRAEKGQAFADSPPLAKARAEQKPEAETPTADEKPAENPSEDAGTLPAAKETPAKKEGVSTAHDQPSDRGGEVTGPIVESKAQTASVERIAVLGVEQDPQPQPAGKKAGPQKAAAQPAVVVDGQTCQTTPTQDPVVPTAGEQAIPTQAGQPVSTGPSMTVSTTTDDTGTVPPSFGVSDPAASAARNGETRPATPAKHSAEVISATPQKPAVDAVAVQTASIEPSPARVVSIETPALNANTAGGTDKINVAATYQPPTPEAKQAPQVQGSVPTETDARSGQGFSDTSQAPPQSEAGVTRPAPVEGVATQLSSDKSGVQAVQNGPEIQPESSFASSDTSAASASRISTQTTVASASEPALLKSPAQDLAEQLGTVFRSGWARPDKQVTIRLQPPELGSVTIRIEEQGQQIKAVLEVSRAETGRDIEQALPQVVRGLQEAGLQVRKFDVVVSDQLGKDAAGGSSSHDAWNQQQDSRGPGTAGRQGGGSANTGFAPIHSFARPRPAVSTQGGLDLLA